MSQDGVRAATELVVTTCDLIRSIRPADWAADTACRGWRVQDLAGHLAFLFNFIADPDLKLPANPSGLAERLNDAAVLENAGWSPEQVVAYYHAQSEAGLATLAALRTHEMRDQPVELLDLGTYRLAQLADAVAFDHLVHLHSDLLAPAGPVSIDVEIPVAVTIDPAIDWMLAGLSGMCGGAVGGVLDSPIGLRLTGVTERSFVVAHDVEDPEAVTVTETGRLPDDVAATDVLDFTRWATRRIAWRSAVDIVGERGRVAAVLDAIKII